MTDHPLTQTAAAVLWNAHRTPNALPFHEQGRDYVRDQTAMLRAAFDAGREHEREHADPHHDPRPWQDCTREDIRKSDLVESRSLDILRIGVAHHEDGDGDWCTEDGALLTNDTYWPLRRIPAPTPPAEEVELPTEHPAHITDVEVLDGGFIPHAAIDMGDEWCGVDDEGECRMLPAALIAAFTLPDGTRARRDGEHEDGTPRFVKVEADQ